MACVAVGTLIADLGFFAARLCGDGCLLDRFLGSDLPAAILGNSPGIQDETDTSKSGRGGRDRFAASRGRRLLWQGSTLTVVSGFILLVGWTVTTSGWFPHVVEVLAEVLGSIGVGLVRSARYRYLLQGDRKTVGATFTDSLVELSDSVGGGGRLCRHLCICQSGFGEHRRSVAGTSGVSLGKGSCLKSRLEKSSFAFLRFWFRSPG